MGPPREPTAIGMRLGWWCFEMTTPLTKGTYEAAARRSTWRSTAADTCSTASGAAYGLCRPPGHHAGDGDVRRLLLLQQRGGRGAARGVDDGGKVAVLDVDYHHGNGTQQIFYDRGDVQFVSLHGDPARAYPYLTGFDDELGQGGGVVRTCNFPLAAGINDEQYLDLLRARATRSSPSLPTWWSSRSASTRSSRIRSATRRSPPTGSSSGGAGSAGLGKRTVVLQEGGYAVEELGENARRWLHAGIGDGSAE